MSYENAKLMNLEDGQLLLSVLDKRKADIISVSDTTAEAVKTFSDGADGLPMGVTVGIEPVQDLHGQDAPYPAGGGKNLIDYLSCTGIGARDGTDNKYPEDTTAVTGDQLFLGTAYGNNGGILKGIGTFSMQQGDYITISFDVVSMSDANTFAIGVGNYDGGGTTKIITNITPTNNRVVVSVPAGSDYSNTGIFVQPEIRNGKATIKNLQAERGQVESPSYAPYSNICPISGWTGAKVTRTGKNLINLNKYLYDQKGLTFSANADGSFTMSGTPTATWSALMQIKKPLPVPLEAGTYILSIENTLPHYIYINLYDENGNQLQKVITSGNKSITVTTSNKIIEYIVMVSSLSTSTNYNETIKIMLEKGQTATEWEADKSTTYEIAFPSEAGTVYGATLTENADGTGTLVVDKAMWTLDGVDESWGEYPSYEGYYITISEMKLGTRQDGISNMLKDAKDSSAGQKNTMWLGVNSKIMFAIGVYETMGATLAEFKQYLSNNNLQVVFPLATPKTYTISAPQMETLKGKNVIFADAGDIKAVDYPADTKLYIDGKVAELQALILENISNS